MCIRDSLNSLIPEPNPRIISGIFFPPKSTSKRIATINRCCQESAIIVNVSISKIFCKVKVFFLVHPTKRIHRIASVPNLEIEGIASVKIFADTSDRSSCRNLLVCRNHRGCKVCVNCEIISMFHNYSFQAVTRSDYSCLLYTSRCV